MRNGLNKENSYHQQTGKAHKLPGPLSGTEPEPISLIISVISFQLSSNVCLLHLLQKGSTSFLSNLQIKSCTAEQISTTKKERLRGSPRIPHPRSHRKTVALLGKNNYSFQTASRCTSKNSFFTKCFIS